MAGRDNQVILQTRNEWLSACIAPYLCNVQMRDGYPRRHLDFGVGSTKVVLERAFSVFQRFQSISQGKHFCEAAAGAIRALVAGYCCMRETHERAILFLEEPSELC